MICLQIAELTASLAKLSQLDLDEIKKNHEGSFFYLTVLVITSAREQNQREMEILLEKWKYYC